MNIRASIMNIHHVMVERSDIDGTPFPVESTTIDGCRNSRRQCIGNRRPNAVSHRSPWRYTENVDRLRRRSLKRDHTGSNRCPRSSPKLKDELNLRIIKATTTDLAYAKDDKDLQERVWRMSYPPRDLETRKTITPKMFLDAQALVRLKMSRNPCSSGPNPSSHVSSSSEPDFTGDLSDTSKLGQMKTELKT